MAPKLAPASIKAPRVMSPLMPLAQSRYAIFNGPALRAKQHRRRSASRPAPTPRPAAATSIFHRAS
jgi:hypothetical protein